MYTDSNELYEVKLGYENHDNPVLDSELENVFKKISVEMKVLDESENKFDETQFISFSTNQEVVTLLSVKSKYDEIVKICKNDKN